MTERVATVADIDGVVEILVGAFHADPLWSWAFPDDRDRSEQHRQFWKLAVEGALRYPWVWLDETASATSVWIPPGGTELSDDQAGRLEPLLDDLLGAPSRRVLETLDELDRTHPKAVPHYYLSLLGTSPDRRGRGYGLGLLAANLRRIDGEGFPAYLEASNPANVPLYERHGFEVIGWFRAPDDGPEVFTMWREPASPADSD